MQLRDAIYFSYRDLLTAVATTAVEWEPAGIVEMYDEDSDNAKREENGDAPEIGNYSISSELPEELVLMPLFVHSAFCLACRVAYLVWVYDT